MTTPKDADSFEKWLSDNEAPILWAPYEYDNYKVTWKASRIQAMRDVLAMLPEYRDMCTCRFGECICGRHEHNKIIDEIRARIEDALKGKE